MGNFSTRPGPKNIAELEKLCNFSREEIQVLYDNFLKMSGGRSTVSRRDFIKGYNKTFSSGDARKFAENVFRTFDTDGNESLDFREFLVGLSCKSAEDLPSKIEWSFKVYDRNGDGYISRQEMKSVIHSIIRMNGIECNIQDTVNKLTQDLYQTVDLNNDKSVSFEEFKSSVEQNSTLLDLLQARPPH
ncbi:hypothetical protein LOTGIDRAFT_227902 [Lottia gigantea]|uniref:EF-hand domain-containing protein n=1 Tax=Lottia gigantea TaxID=225164 RepID=V4B473_LOTGI|nr:hypothetical protein LOTGIDRAFT_227902 [Lottia gigantea]ESP05248.1 hypothetical protein LOTGIDRAFT_227902 [Lottia gigantea]